MAITFRDEKNAPLTHEELDANFRSFFFTASFSENNLSLQRKDGVTINVPIGGEAFADFQANGGSIGDVYIADSQITGSRMIIDLFQGQFYDKTKAMNSDGGTLSSDEWYIDFDPAASSPYYVHFGPNFAISSSGYLYASGAVIEGDITASSGLIGGFSITPDTIHGPTTLGIPSFYISGSASNTGYFISSSNFNVKGSGDITGSAVLFSGGTVAGWTITNSQIKKSTHIVLDASNESISINDSTFGNKGIQLEYNDGAPRFYVGDATGSFVKFDGTNVSLSTALLEISASNIEISSTEASMSLGGGSIKLLGASAAIEVGESNKFKISGSVTDAMIVAGAKTGFATNDAGIILGMDATVPTLDLTKDASNYVRFNTTSGVDIKTDTFKLDTTYFDIDTTTQRLNIFNTASAEIIRLGEISDDASDLFGLKIFDGAGTGSSNTIAMFGQQGNKVGGWEVTDSQIRSIPATGLGGNYAEDEVGLVIHSSGKLESSNFATNLKGWRIDTLGNGSAEFENMRIRGTLKTTVFEKETVNVVGGQLMVTNASTIEALRDADGNIIAGSSSYAANAVTLSLANVSGFKEGEILKVKSVDNTGFSVEYMYVSGSKRYSEDTNLTYNTGSIDPDGLAGEIYVERAFGGVVAISSSLTTLSGEIPTTSTTDINVTTSSGIKPQDIIKIDDERLKVTAINSNVLTVTRGYHDTTAQSHTAGDTVFLVDVDKEFLAGLVSTSKPYTEGQVILSTGVYNPQEDISSGYILMNANPRDVSTPYMDIVERTGSGVYDLQLRSRLGDLSGLSSGYLYGNNEPGFGLYTENGFFKGSITADTGSIAGILHIATKDGSTGLETGQKISLGTNVSGTNDGIYINNNNYWYTDGAWKVGGSSNFISLDNFTDGNLVISTETFTLDTSTFIISSSLNNGTLAAGTNAGNMTSTTGTGVYLDGNGKFRVGTGTTGANYIYWDGTTLNIKGNIDITGGSGVNTAELNAATSSLSGSLGTEISASDAAFSASVEATTNTLDGKIFTDSAGRAVRPPTASAEGLYLASTNLGFYKDGEWKTYMDNQGDFFLTGSEGNKLAWDSSTGTLEIAGEINITSGNAATQDYVTGSIDTVSGSIATGISASNAALSASISSSTATLQDGLDSANNVIAGKAAIFRQNDAPSTSGRTVGDMWIDSNDGNKVYVWNGTQWAETPDGTYDQTVLINSTSASLSSSVALDIFTDQTGRLVGTPSTSSAGLYLGDSALGFYSASEWRTYMADNGNFYLTGSDGNFLTWDGGQLSIKGSINITGGNAATSTDVSNAQAAANAFASASAENAVLSGSAAADSAYSASVTASQEYSDTISGSIATDISQSAVNTSASFATQAQTNAAFSLVQAGLNSIFRQNEPPTTESRHQGDMWIDQNDGERLYIFSGSEWITASDSTYDQSTLISNTSASIALDTFTDSTGKIVSTPDPNASGLYLGDSALGFYSASAWRTYMADNGNFFLTGSDSNYLKWDGGALTISGNINILGGNAATNDSVASASADAALSGSNAAADVSSSLTSSIDNAQTTADNASVTAASATQTAITASLRSVDADGKITFNPTPSGEGLFLNANNLGYYSGSAWNAYLSASGEFYLTGSGSSGMSWDGQELSIDGTVTARAGEIGGVTIGEDKLHTGTGTHGNSNTGFYLDSGSKFSLGDKLIWDGSTLTINGEVNVTNSDDFASQAELEAEQSSSADLFLAAFASASQAQESAESASLAAAFSASAAQSAAEIAAQNALNTATGSLVTTIGNVATTASLSASAAQSAAEATAAAALNTATGSLVTTIGNVATTASLSASAAQSAAEATAAAALNTATGSLETSIGNVATTASLSASAAQSAAEATAASALSTATSSLETSIGNVATTASLSASAAQSAAEATAAAALNTATGSLQEYADGAVTAVTGSIDTAQATANAATSSAAAAQSTANTATASAAAAQATANDATSSAAAAQATANAATGSILEVIAATSSMVNPTTYEFGPDAQMTLASIPTPPTGSGLYFNATAFGFYNGSGFMSYMGADGTFILSGSGDDGLVWNGQSLQIGNPGVGPSFEYNFSGSLDSNLFDSSITTTNSYAAPVFGNEFNNNATGWDEGFHTKALFDRKDGGIFEWDIVVSKLAPATMIGLFKESPTSFNYDQQHHTVYFQSNNIIIYENGGGKGTIKTGAWVTDTPTLFRVSIQLKPTGAVYKVFKNGDFTVPYATYDSQVNGLTDRYIRPGASIHYGGTTNNLLFSRMSGGKTLGMSTKISGNGIQTGGIQSTNWGTTSGSRLDLDAGTFKLGGSAAPKLSWDGTSLDIIGNIQVTNPDTFATPSTKNKSDYNIILVSTGSLGTQSPPSITYISESLGYTGGNGNTYFYDNNNNSNGNTNPANISGYDTEDYDLYVFDNRNWSIDGSEIKLALDLFDNGKSVLITGNDTTAANYTGSYNTEWPIKATVSRSGTNWMVGPSASGKGIPASHPILAGLSGNISTASSGDGGKLITQLKAFPQGGTIVQPFSITNETGTVSNTNDVFTTSGTGQGITSFIATNPRGGRLVNLNLFSLATGGSYGSLTAQAAKNLTSFLLRTDPAIEAHYMQVTSITGEMVTTGKIESTNYNYTSGDYSTAGTQFNLDTGNLISEQFSIIDGDANFKGDISGASGTFEGAIEASTGTIGGFTIHADKIFSGADENTSTFTTQTGRTILSSSGAIHANQFYLDSSGNAGFKGSLSGADITGATGTFGGTLSVGNEDLSNYISQTAAGQSSVFPNTNFIIEAADGRPAGVKATYNSNVVTNISYSGSAAAGNLRPLRIHNSSDSTIGAGFQAFPVVVGQNYKVFIKAKRDGATTSNGVYFRIYEKNVAVAAGGVISNESGNSESGVVEETSLGALSGRTIDGVATSTFENFALTDEYKIYQFIYTPTAGTKHASLSILNWSGNGTRSIYVERVSILPVNEDIYTGIIGGWKMDSTAIYSGQTKDTSGYADAGGITLSAGGSIHAKQFYIDTAGNANFKGSITGATGDFAGNLNGASITGGTITIGSTYINDPRYFRVDNDGISLGGTSTSTGEFQVNAQGRLIATSGQIGNWNIGNASLLVSDNQGIQLDPSTESIKIRYVHPTTSVATDKVVLSAADLDPISATKTINISMAYDDDTALAKRDSSSISSNNANMDDWNASTGATGTFPNGNLPSTLNFSKLVTRADATTTAFTHDGGNLPIVIPIGKLDSVGTFRIQVDNSSATGTGSYSYNFYQYFSYVHVRYENTIFYNIYKLTAGQHGGSSTYSIQSAYSQSQILGQNMSTHTQANALKIEKSNLRTTSGTGTTSYSADIEMKDTQQSWGVGHPSQTINHTYNNLDAGSYKIQVILRTEYYVTNKMNVSQIRLGTVTSTPGITWRTMLAPYNASYTPVTVGTFTDQVLIGLNGVQVSGGAGSVVLGEVNDSGVASVYGDALVTGTLTANTSNLSDRRLKEDILTIDNPLELIGNLSPKSFTWRNNINPHEKRGKSYGFIAQELTGSFAHLVNTKDKIGEMEDVLTVDQMPIVALNTAGIKALMIKIDSLESKIAELEISGSE